MRGCLIPLTIPLSAPRRSASRHSLNVAPHRFAPGRLPATIPRIAGGRSAVRQFRAGSPWSRSWPAKQFPAEESVRSKPSPARQAPAARQRTTARSDHRKVTKPSAFRRTSEWQFRTTTGSRQRGSPAGGEPACEGTTRGWLNRDRARRARPPGHLRVPYRNANPVGGDHRARRRTAPRRGRSRDH